MMLKHPIETATRHMIGVGDVGVLTTLSRRPPIRTMYQSLERIPSCLLCLSWDRCFCVQTWTVQR